VEGFEAHCSACVRMLAAEGEMGSKHGVGGSQVGGNDATPAALKPGAAMVGVRVPVWTAEQRLSLAALQES